MDVQKPLDGQEIISSQKLMDAQNKKNIIWNTIGISSNSFYAMILLILVTRVNGLEVQGGFIFAFYIASIFHTIGVYGGRIYQISDVKQEFTNSNYISLKFISILFMFLLAIVFCIVNGYSLQRTLLIFIFLAYRALESVGDAYLGVMERNYRLDLTGKSMILKTFVGLVLFVIINLWTKNIYFASMSFVLTFGLVLVFYDMRVAARFDKIVIGFGSHIIELFKKCFSIFIFAFLTLLILNVTRFFVDIYLSEELLGIFNIILMPAAIMTLFTQFVFQPFMMELTFALHNKEFHRFRRRVGKLFLLLAVMGAFTIAVAFLIGIPVLSFINGVDLTGFRWSLALMILAGTIGGGSVVFSLLMTLMRQMNLQIYLFVATFVVGIISSILCIHLYGIYGAFVGYALMQIIQIILFSLGYHLTYKKYKNQSSE